MNPDSSRQIERTAAQWLARRDGDHWSARDQTELETWLAAATAHKVAYLRLEAAWSESGRLRALGAGRSGTLAAGAWPARPRRPAATARPHPSRRRPGRLLRRFGMLAAAAVLLAIGIGLGWRHQAVQRASYATAVGSLAEVTLADGSRATLSSDTRIAVSLSRSERHIELQQGEAYFTVRKDPARPFVVEAAEHGVVAVGTRFAVRRDGSHLRVVVTEGVVRLESHADEAPPATLLPAGSLALVSDGGTVVRSFPLDEADRYLGWRQGYVSFHHTPLAAAVAELNRYSTRKLVVADASIASLPLGGNFRWTNTEAFVRLLEQGFPVRAERHGEVIELHAR